MTTLFVAVGGLLGVLARWGISRLTLHSEALIWSTVGVNIVGSFLLGLLVAEQWFDRDLREGLGVGFLGGFTTFSTFSVQVVMEADAGEPARAAILPIGVGCRRRAGSRDRLRRRPTTRLTRRVRHDGVCGRPPDGPPWRHAPLCSAEECREDWSAKSSSTPGGLFACSASFFALR